jgi:hypothetical protein
VREELRLKMAIPLWWKEEAKQQQISSLRCEMTNKKTSNSESNDTAGRFGKLRAGFSTFAQD